MIVQQQLREEICGVCGVAFAMPLSLHNDAQRDHGRQFWCPNGHQLHFTGLTPEQRLRQRLANVEEDRNWERARANDLQRSLSATKGQLTKTRKRIANGVCPCCHRTFTNVSRHMSTRHPEFDPEAAR